MLTVADVEVDLCPQVRAKVYILERPPLGVHSKCMERALYLDRPERSG